MMKFYYHPTPNPSKVALFLEETGLDYELVPVDTARGEQHSAAYLAVNPNGKVPALIDDGIVVFDSSAILLYLARKTGRFLGHSDRAGEAELLSWLMFIGTGVAPFTGQAVHFKHFAPKPNDYAAHRYSFEAERHWTIINTRLSAQEWMLGDGYSIVDMSLWGWCRGLVYLFGEDAWERFPHVQRFYAVINERPAAKRANELSSRHAFKTEVDAETLRNLFRHRDLAA
jgi:GSH-dependent disulfide-bond oxidoreductase